MFTASPVLKTANVTIAGQPVVMACTMYALFRFEELMGRNPPPGRKTARAWVWALLVTFQPALTVQDVGALPPGEYAAALEAAQGLITTPGGNAADRQDAPAEPPGWLDLWATGRRDLGLAEAEFWALSPAMFDALWKRLEDQREFRLYGHAMTCAAVTNVHVDSEKGSYLSPDYFMPGKRGEEERARLVREQRESLREKIRGAAGILGAKVTKRK